MASQQSNQWQKAMMTGAVHTAPLNLAVIP